MKILSIMALMATSVLGGPCAAEAASAHSMMVAPNDLPGQDLSAIGALHMDDMSSMAKPLYDDGKGPIVLGAQISARVSPAAAETSSAAPIFAGTGYVFGQAPAAGASAGTGGYFDPAVTWPLVSLHAIVLPDGRILNYGTNVNAANTFMYDVWDPKLGDSSTAHSVLPNTTTTDIFCSFQSLDWQTGEVLITGGDTGSTYRNNAGTNATTLFAPTTNSIRPQTAMKYGRWYPTVVGMPNGDMVALGGYLSSTVPTVIPEVYNSSATPNWRTLTGAGSNDAFGLTQGGWFYPKAWLTPRGDIFMIANTGKMYSIDPTGVGTITNIVVPKGMISPARGTFTLPTVMYAPGKLLSLRFTTGATPVAVAQIIDINAPQPIVTNTANIDQFRYWATATVLADGKVAVTGGSAKANAAINIDYTTQIWDPATGAWTAGAVATKPRLYHSIALLLPDATVLTGAGGAPGPVTERNAEIYYPPYLYLNDGSGLPAPRPTLADAPVALTIGDNVNATVGPNDAISRVTFVRAGSVTHSTNIDQRFFDLPFTQTGASITATLPTDSRVLVPGYYMMFVLQNGVPSVAKIIRVTPS